MTKGFVDGEEAKLLAPRASYINIFLKEGRVEGGVEGGINSSGPDGGEVGVCMRNSVTNVLPHVTISTEFERWLCGNGRLPRLT